MKWDFHFTVNFHLHYLLLNFIQFEVAASHSDFNLKFNYLPPKSPKNSLPGFTPVTSSQSRARVQAT